MQIRKIEEKDIDNVSELMIRNYDEVISRVHSKEVMNKFKSHNTPDKIKTQMFWKDIFVIDEAGVVVGTGALANFGNTDLPKYSISNFFIKPELHGNGLGKLLFKKLLDVAKNKGVEKLHVPSSRNAIGFYKKMGFIINDIQTDLDDEITWMTMDIY